MSTPPPLQIEHRVRVSAFEAERTWQLLGDSLRMSEGGAAVLEIPLAGIHELRLAYEPTRFQANRFRCHLKCVSGLETVIQNETYCGIASFEDRTASYLELVEALVRRTAAANPACVLKTGTSRLNWWLQAVFLTVCGAGLLVVLWFLYSVIGWLVLAKLVLLAFLAPIAIRWFRKNRPGTFAPDAIPAGMLPKPPAAG